MYPEIENIHHPQIKNMNLAMSDIKYRSPHLHPEIELLYVLKGNPVCIINNEKYQFNKGDFILINANDLHEIICENETATFLSLNILPEYFYGYYPQMSKTRFLDHTLISENYELFTYTFFKLTKVYFSKEPYYQIQCASLINIMLYDILKNFAYQEVSTNIIEKYNKKSQRLSKIIQYIKEHYDEKLTLTSLANYMNLSPSFLSHFIKENLHQSFREFLTYIRYVNSKALIDKGNMNLVDICYTCGFSDYRYMNSAFKKYSNCTPNAYKTQKENNIITNYKNNEYKEYSSNEIKIIIDQLLNNSIYEQYQL